MNRLIGVLIAVTFVAISDRATGNDHTVHSGHKLGTDFESPSPRVTEDFNFGWLFAKCDRSDGSIAVIPDADLKFQKINLPHDWSIRESYRQENTAASTGFLPGGVAWYRKSFRLPASDRGRNIRIEFDGVYCRSDVWINGHHLGFRPNGYSSFSYDLTPHLRFGDSTNEIIVKVDHSAYVDSRWYTGSGIYRNVRLVKTAPTHIPQWGVRVTTPLVREDHAAINVRVEIEKSSTQTTTAGEPIVEVCVFEGDDRVSDIVRASKQDDGYRANVGLPNPKRWSTESPFLYRLVVNVRDTEKTLDRVETTFGIRTIRFDADRGFFLNDVSTKIKGVNLHHDAGAIGAAVPKAVWRYRLAKLKSIGVNAIRMSHNPHSVELLDLCDEMGMLVMDEFFDEWDRPKAKSIRYLGDHPDETMDATNGYTNYFDEWAERDLKDLIRRDFNHPSVIMWSIGNEIEWTFPHYSQVFARLNPESVQGETVPVFDPAVVKPALDEVTEGEDPLATIAQRLSRWVKEEDITRPVTCGSVRPSISAVSGYFDAVDITGFNYRAECYDAAHATYPQMKIIGSENWGAYSEWKAVRDREFVSGMFAWTGFAYLGEAGPWPRKGLNLSFFDYAGFQTPRGHFFECLWKDEPKVYMVTTPASKSEYTYSEKDGWQFEMQMHEPPYWSALRKWEWYPVNEHWNYRSRESIVVQVYTNCEEAELFLNGRSLGKQRLEDFPDDNIIKWMLPFEEGELSVTAVHHSGATRSYSLSTAGELAGIELVSDTGCLEADGYDVAHVRAVLVDRSGQRICTEDVSVDFEVQGAAKLLAVDNGWEKNVEPHYRPTVTSHHGRAMAIIQSGFTRGECVVRARAAGLESKPVELNVR
ncbi:sugar-binding domain-containing protein [Rhodopirellula sallentina]|uniref:Glycoside hydrolase family 2 sugar binding protein n=1 Tax=Rhodopirellula sallentina SM41 TaxID=1263870 RepID=M5U5X4_9BACT|nr:sugar-binding domain-containing protein [Rhodopirellula sallentina]EMI56862.1 glycoside hydrolase family 2 sugar binding protein [Rhodopirellula sallentina SM41]